MTNVKIVNEKMFETIELIDGSCYDIDTETIIIQNKVTKQRMEIPLNVYSLFEVIDVDLPKQIDYVKQLVRVGYLLEYGSKLKLNDLKNIKYLPIEPIEFSTLTNRIKNILNNIASSKDSTTTLFSKFILKPFLSEDTVYIIGRQHELLVTYFMNKFSKLLMCNYIDKGIIYGGEFKGIEKHIELFEEIVNSITRLNVDQKINIAVSGLSGVGKTTLVNFFNQSTESSESPISTTTRPIRENETDGIDYNFVKKSLFEKMEMIEKTSYMGNSYGITKKDYVKTKAVFNTFVVTIDGYKQLNETLNNVLHIHLTASKETQLKFLKKRSGNEVVDEKRYNEVIPYEHRKLITPCNTIDNTDKKFIHLYYDFIGLIVLHIINKVKLMII